VGRSLVLPLLLACGAPVACTPQAERVAGPTRGVQIRFLTADDDCGIAGAEPTAPGLPPADAVSLRLEVRDSGGGQLASLQVAVDPAARCQDEDGNRFPCPFDEDSDGARERQLLLEDLPADTTLSLRVWVYDEAGAPVWSGRREGVRVAGGSQTLVRLVLTRHGAATCVGRSSAPRLFASTTPLRDGRVLVAGGYDRIVEWCGKHCVRLGATDRADVYDPATGRLHEAGTLSTPRALHAAVPLADGRVVIVGGAGAVRLDLSENTVPLQLDDPALPSGPRATFEVFEPGTGTFAGGGELSEARVAAAAAAIGGGRVLVAGGGVRSGDGTSPTAAALMTWEAVDPAGGAAPAEGLFGDCNAGRLGAVLQRLPGSPARWLLAGSSFDEVVPFELYDGSGFVAPGDDDWRWLGFPDEPPPDLFMPTVEPLGDGRRLLVVGGAVVDPLPLENRWRLVWLPKAAELVVAAADGAVREVGSGSPARLYHSAAPLPDGTVLVLGGLIEGEEDLGVTGASQRFSAEGDPAPGPALALARAGHSSVALPDGTVLTVGGFTLDPERGLRLHDSAEVLNLGGE